ncbi:MAG: putative Fe-S cluster assembly protein SufT [Gammaproteobacteria bacterium]|nr:putative Fe-S cluster assembly protein SufT [Gammaproteobacteria bacterium]
MYSRESEPFTLSRETEAALIPAGDMIRLPPGTIGYITQSLGGSFTVYVDGSLFRIAGADADALGKEPPEAPALPEDASREDVEAIVWSQLRTCYDPEIPVNIVDLGLIYSCDLNEEDPDNRRVAVQMTLTAPGCGMGEFLVADVKEKLEIIPTIAHAEVELVFDPPWNHSMMSEAARLQTGMMY